MYKGQDKRFKGPMYKGQDKALKGLFIRAKINA